MEYIDYMEDKKRFDKILKKKIKGLYVSESIADLN